MSRARLFFALLFSVAALLFSAVGYAGGPSRLSERKLAPARTFRPDAPKGEVAQLKHAAAAAKSQHQGLPPPPPPPPKQGQAVHNAYLAPTAGTALTRMSSRLEGKKPLAMAAKHFEENAAILPKAETPKAGAKAATVYKDKGVVLIPVGETSYLLTLKLAEGVKIRDAELQKAVSAAPAALFSGPLPPDTIVQMPDGTFVLQVSSVRPKDPRANPMRRKTGRYLVLRTPRRKPRPNG